ncbi:hypothetical protein ACFXHA_39565 [Nocardia sp. NPDC059240]|uniref:hypothetical protein n=1 Tax=Nocardia sp. NPDC059240 TaxID=3346786 RepID=UPI0036981EB5
MTGQHRRSEPNPLSRAMSSPALRTTLTVVAIPLSLILALMFGVIAGTLLGVYAPGSLPLPN